MNAHSDTTAMPSGASFPIQHPSQSSFDDLEDILSMLRVVMVSMGGQGGFSARFANDIGMVIALAMDKLEPILIHLRNLDEQDSSDRYLNARRKWIESTDAREVLL